MASTINASTTGVGGIVTSADNTGNIDVQSAGTTVMSVTSAGVDVTGELDVTTNLVVNGQGYSPTLTLTDGATINWDTDSGQVATVTLGGNRTVAAPTNLESGAFYALEIVQGTGGQTLAWNAVFKFTGAVAPTLSTTAGAKDYITFRSDGTNLYEQGRSIGVA
jgi:hypothetical protein